MRAAKAGSIQFKVDRTGVLHCGVGKVDFTEAQLADNIRYTRRGQGGSTCINQHANTCVMNDVKGRHFICVLVLHLTSLDMTQIVYPPTDPPTISMTYMSN